LKIPQVEGKKLIPLSIGDPAVFGNLDPPQAAVDAVVAAVRSKKWNGYAPSTGYERTTPRRV
jgi:tyrosine aminotransferase